MRRQPESTSSRRRLTAKERESEALELRKQGFTFEEIGCRLGITRQGAHKAVNRALHKINEKCQENAEELRTLESQRLDELHKAFWRKAKAGDIKAADQVLKIMERRTKLLGLDLGMQIKISHRQEIELLRAFKAEIRTDRYLSEKYKEFFDKIGEEETQIASFRNDRFLNGVHEGMQKFLESFTEEDKHAIEEVTIELLEDLEEWNKNKN
jgi:DNA-binding CsgD family transcriptional regulator